MIFKSLYLGSLRDLGFDLLTHDIRFVEDNWESPTLGAWGLGWEVWLNGMEVSQFTYFQQVGGLDCRPVMGEITYGLERLAMYIQGKESIFDIVWTDGPFGTITYGDVFHQNEVEQSIYNFEKADTRCFCCSIRCARTRLPEAARGQAGLARLRTNGQGIAYLQLLDARRAVSVTERQRFILSVRTLARGVAEAYRRQPRSAGLPAAEERRVATGRLMGHATCCSNLGTEELPPRTLQSLSTALRRGLVDGLSAPGFAHGKASQLRDAAPARRTHRAAAPRPRRIAGSSGADRRSQALSTRRVHPPRRPRLCARVAAFQLPTSSGLTTDKGAWLVLSRH